MECHRHTIPLLMAMAAKLVPPTLTIASAIPAQTMAPLPSRPLPPTSIIAAITMLAQTMSRPNLVHTEPLVLALP